MDEIDRREIEGMVRTDGPFASQGRNYPFQLKLEFCLLVSESVRHGLSISAAIDSLVDEEVDENNAKLLRAELIAAKNTGRRNYYRWREELLNMTDPERSLRWDFALLGMTVESIDLRAEGFPVPISCNSVLAPHPSRGRPRKAAG